MRSITATDVSRSEWRWVIIFSGLLVALTLLPYAWAFASNVPNDSWQFMGMLHNHIDGATYLSKIGQGVRGSWLFMLSYTPESHAGAAINEYYLFLGHLSRILGLKPLLMYHVARLVTGFMMYASIYHLGSTIWDRLRPRRLFFSLLAVGSGLGWLTILFAPHNSVLPTDLVIPESIPFYATLANPHFPLSIALIALIAATFMKVFRPGFNLQPTLLNGGASVALMTIALCIIQPQGWVPIAATVAAYITLLTLMRFFGKPSPENMTQPALTNIVIGPVQRFMTAIPKVELNWALLVWLPAVPFFIYYLAVVNDNPAMRIWNAQNYTPSPTPDKYIIGFGLLLLVAVPGIWRAVRHFERDGDRFMLLWLIVNALLLYAPFNLQRRLAIGLIIPIVYFAVRALEDYWLHVINPRWRRATLITLFVLVIPSNIFILGLPLFAVFNPSSGLQEALLLPADSWHAIQWLNDNSFPGDIVLAKSSSSLWIPPYTSLRVVYGHPYESLNAGEKQQQIMDWYSGKNCQKVIVDYHVGYILIEAPLDQAKPIAAPPLDPGANPGTTPTESTDNGATCLKQLGLDTPVATFGKNGTAIYEVR